MIVWLAAALAGTDPILADLELPADAQVAIVRGDVEWTVTVGDRKFTVAPPRTPDDELALRALISSLWTDLDLLPMTRLPPPPPPPEVVVPRPRPVPAPVPEVPPSPPLVVLVPLPAPAPPAPEPPPIAPPVVPEVAPSTVRVSVGAELVVRDRIWPAGGGWVDVRSGIRGGFGGRVGGRLPRTTRWGPETRLSEVYADLLVWARPAASVVGTVGLGLAGRWYAADGQPVAAHALPRASAGVSFPVDVGPAELALGAGVECDLLATEIGYPVDLTLLPPIAGRVEITFSFEPVRGIPTSFR